MTFCYIWEFRVKPSTIEAFEVAYGPDGPWVRLFRRSPDYLRTELLKDSVDSFRYLTVDYWQDRRAYERFRGDFRTEFEDLDETCRAYTESEGRIGDFEVQDGP